MEELEEIGQESRDTVGNLIILPAPMKKSDTRDSISSVDSDVSVSMDRRGSKDDEADHSDSCSSDNEKKTTIMTTTMMISTKKKNFINNDKMETQESIDRDSGVESDHVINDSKESKDLEEEEEANEVGEKKEKNESQANKETLSNAIEKTILPDSYNSVEQNDFIPPNDELADRICSQVEFYFSDENIVKDAFLLKHVKRNKEGYVSLKLISSFKRVKHLSRDWRVVGAALARSEKLQINSQGTKLRRVDPLPPFDQTAPSRTILAARLPVDKLSVESVAAIFRPCGEIALIRVLKPGHPAPAEIRQAIAKRLELDSNEECAMVEFTDSASARMAMQMSLGDGKIFELHQTGDKRRKQQPTKKSAITRITRDEIYTSSSGPSGSETEDGRSKHRRSIHVYPPPSPPIYQVYPGHPYSGSPTSETWLSRRLSSCSVSGSESSATTGLANGGGSGNGGGYVLRRMSSCSGSSSDNSNFGRRFSTCSSGSETGYFHTVCTNPHFHPTANHNRRLSCCSGSSGECPGNYYNPVRRGSADCGPYLRRLSSCSRDSGFEVPPRRLSMCSSGSEQNSSYCRPRSNSSITMPHLPENIIRLPAGPDGTRGFGRSPRVNRSTVEPTC